MQRRSSKVLWISLAAGAVGSGLMLYYCAGGRLKCATQQCSWASSRFRCSWSRPGCVHALGEKGTGKGNSYITLDPSVYPEARRDASVVDVLHGVSVPDPYRWLEDPDAEETKQFVEKQNKLTAGVLENCDTRSQLRALLKKLQDYPKHGTPFKKGERYFYFYNTGLQQQSVLYTLPALGAKASVLLDPNTLSSDGTIALTDVEFTDDGKLMAYSLSSGGSDWNEIKVLGIEDDGTTRSLPDKLQFVKFSSMAWTHDNKGFFYNRYPAPKNSGTRDLGTETDSNTHQLLCYHILGQDQSKDAVVYAMPDHPTWMASAEVSDDGRYVLIYITDGCLPANKLYVLRLTDMPKLGDGSPNFQECDFSNGTRALPLNKLVDTFEASFDFVASDVNTLYFKTNLKAPCYRLVKTDISKASSAAAWRDVIQEHPQDLLRSALALKGNFLVVRYLKSACSVLQLHSLRDGSLIKRFELPGLGSVSSLSGSRHSNEFFHSFQSFVNPGSIFRVVVSKESVTSDVFHRTQLSVLHDPEDYTTRQVFVKSRDGTDVPLFITHKNGVQLDGSNPTLLYGYGGFNISLEPSFSATRLAFMQGYNAVFAMANLRGGGEFGVTWRDAGSTKNKQNVFDDFIACSKYLTEAKICSPSKLTIQGGSNGGLLVAACANQAPSLYSCVIGQVGVMDMLRFHKFTIGHAWVSDYGDPGNGDDFAYIFPYSPLHNVHLPDESSKQYPAMILSTGDHDDRVVPLHSLKLIATLQYVAKKTPKSIQQNPLLIRVDVRSGHGMGRPTEKVIDESADLFSFAAECMKASWVANTS